MQVQLQGARQLRGQLQTQVEAFRQSYPEALLTWAEDYRRVCQGYLSTLPQPGIDSQTLCYLARVTLEAWKDLPQTGETFISINTAWLSDYLARLQAELAG